jgi:hypothetical protein
MQMADKTMQISADIEPTDVRFSMRSLLVATLLSGIAAAVIAPSFRAIQAENIAIVAALWGLLFRLQFCGRFASRGSEFN